MRAVEFKVHTQSIAIMLIVSELVGVYSASYVIVDRMLMWCLPLRNKEMIQPQT
jgi:hypothetical protein